MSTIGNESGTSVVCRGGYHDHANTVSVIGFPRAKQVQWPLDPVLSLLMGAAPKLNRLHVQLREGRLGSCYHSIVATIHGERGGASRTTRGARSHVGGGACGAGHGVKPFGGNDTAKRRL